MPDLPYDKLTLIPLLVTGIIVLWRDNKAKDATIAEAIRILEKGADATSAMASALDRLRQSLPGAKRDTKTPSGE